VRQYLRTHAYDNADTKDLWTALGAVASQPVPELMNGWIFQPGFPLVTAEVHGNTLRLSQQRFTYIVQESTVGPFWQIPIQIRLVVGNRTEHHRLLLTERETSIEMPAGVTSVFINEGGHGFYRVRYQAPLLQQLLDLGLDRLASIERFALVSDAWATTVGGLTPLPAYLRFTARFKGERDKNVWAVVLDSFWFLNRIISSEDRAALETFVRSCVKPAIDDLGWDAKPGESDLIRQLRGDLLGALGRLGNDAATQQEAAGRYQQYRKNPATVDPNVVPALVAILAHTGNEARYEEFSERYRTASTPQEERRYLFSLAAFRLPIVARRTLERTINGEIRTQDAPFIVGALMANVYSREVAWEFVKANWDQMDRLFPKKGLRRMCGGIVGLATPALEQNGREFFSSRKIDLGGKTLEQYLEQLHIAVSFRERTRHTVQAALVSAL